MAVSASRSRTCTAQPAGGRLSCRAIAVVTTAMALIAGCSGGGSGGRSEGSTPAPSGVSAQSHWSGVVATVQPSVVTIVTDDGIGSGVVFRKGGIVVTNEHVVREDRTVQIALAEGTRVNGEVTATDRATDLAVVQAERRDLPAVRFQTALPRAGEPVIAMGTPLGLEGSVTAGIVSGLGRQIPGTAGRSRALVDLLQTDAAISPGNSGGALVNARGEVVGVNEAYLPPETGAVSIGFAIPAATVVDTVEELLRDGRAAHPYLGIVPGRLTPEITRALGVRIDRGAVVMDVLKGGPAATAGLRRGDVVTRIGDQQVGSVEQLYGALRAHDPGDQVRVTVNRAGRAVRVNLTFGELPQ